MLPYQIGFSKFTHIQNIEGGLVMHVLLLIEVIRGFVIQASLFV
jgi:hypothetical protein